LVVCPAAKILLAFLGEHRNLARMIAAAVQSANANSVGFNWFDIVVVVVLGFGLFRGRRNGMAKELLPWLEWLVLVPVCGLCHPMLAGVIAGFLPDPLWNRLLAYLALTLAVFFVFMILKRLLAEKLVKSDFFKGSEYYLGMMAGLVRYACVLIFLLALLNARTYKPAEIAQITAYDEKNFGGGLFAGNYFPHLFQVQAAVFKESFIGPRIKDNLGMLLINTAGVGPGQPGKGAPEPPKPKPVIKIGY
jgi:uncharacterized membrane protein required for colicin V production